MIIVCEGIGESSKPFEASDDPGPCGVKGAAKVLDGEARLEFDEF